MVRRISIVWMLAASSLLGANAVTSAPHVRNFGQVNDKLYRGGQPTAVGLEELGALGVKRVIDLRGEGDYETEEQQLKKLHIEFVHLPMAELSAPTDEQIRRALSLLNDKPAVTTFVHCRRGKDRTGTVIACYRIQHDGWTNEKALEEAKEYGMSSFERGMRSFIAHFTPPSSPLNGLSAAAPSTPLLH